MSALTKTRTRTNNKIDKRDSNYGLSLFGDLAPWGTFDDFFDFGSSLGRNFGYSYPITQENETEYCMEFDMPGLDKEDIDIGIEDGYLSIKGHKVNGSRERNYSQRVKLGDMATTDVDIKAEYNSGVLVLKIPKRQKEDIIKKIVVE